MITCSICANIDRTTLIIISIFQVQPYVPICLMHVTTSPRPALPLVLALWSDWSSENLGMQLSSPPITSQRLSRLGVETRQTGTDIRNWGYKEALGKLGERNHWEAFSPVFSLTVLDCATDNCLHPAKTLWKTCVAPKNFSWEPERPNPQMWS